MITDDRIGDAKREQFQNIRDEQTPDISVVLFTYNRAEFLSRTLDSILTQTYPHFELIICDDCSTDDTAQICLRYAARDSRIQYARREKTIGILENLNSGLALAKYDLIADLHDGGIYYPMLLEKWREALLENPTAAFVFNNYRHLNPDGRSRLVVNNFPELIPGREFLQYCDIHLECPVSGAVMCRKSVYNELGTFDCRYSFWADSEMWFRIALKYDIAFVPEVLIDFSSEQAMPHFFNSGALKARKAISRAHWTLRCRYYRNHPIEFAKQLTKRICSFTESRTNGAAAMLRRRVAAIRPAVLASDSLGLQLRKLSQNLSRFEKTSPSGERIRPRANAGLSSKVSVADVASRIRKKTRAVTKMLLGPFATAAGNLRWCRYYGRLHPAGDIDEHIREAASWLMRAQDAGHDHGVSYGAQFGGSFQESYPETTGYIIRSFIALSELYEQPEYLQRAIEMADWEIDIQLNTGAVMGGKYNSCPTPAIFNTGQVLLGWASVFKRSREARIAKAGRRAAAWMMEMQEPRWKLDTGKLAIRRRSKHGL